MITKSTAEHSAPNTIQQIAVDQILPDPNNRDHIDGDRVASLADSIESEGLLQPILLVRLAANKFRLIAGEHRWRACMKLKRQTVSAIVYETQTDLEIARKKAVENFQRTQLSGLDEARKYRELLDLKMTQVQIGELLGRSQPVVANSLRLLELPGTVQKMIGNGSLSTAHGVILCRFSKWPAPIVTAMAEMVLKEEVSTKDLARDEVPFRYELKRKGLLKELDTGKNEYRATVVLPPGVETDKDFVKIRENQWICFSALKAKPLLAAGEKDLEARQAKRNQSSGRAASGSKMTEKQKTERKQLIARNAKNREHIGQVFKNAIGRLSLDDQKTDRQATALALFSVMEAGQYGNERFKVGCQALGLKATRPKDPESCAKFGLHTLARILAAALITEESENALACARPPTEDMKFIAGTFTAPDPKPAAATVPAKAAKKGR